MGHQLYSSTQSMGSTSRGNPVLGYFGSRALEPPMFPARPYDLPPESRYFSGHQMPNSVQLDKPGGRYMFGERVPNERNPNETGSRVGSLGLDRDMPPEAMQRADSSRCYPGHNSSVFLNDNDTALYKGGDAVGFGSTSAYFPSRHLSNLVSPHLQQTQWPGAEPRGPMPGGVTGVKRPHEEEKDCTHYMMTRTCKFGADCKFDHPFWVPAGGIPNWKEISSVPTNSESPPERPVEPVCPIFVKTGICKYGANCKFDYPKDKGGSLNISENKGDGDLAITIGAEEQGVSGVGKTEKNVTVIKPATMYNSKGLPIRPGETDCTFYVKTGSCKFGSNCRYNHPDRILVNVPPAVMPFVAQDQPLVGYSGMLPQQSVGAPIPPQKPVEHECTLYIKSGECKFGPSCKFHHPLNRPDPSVKLALAGLPRREGETICPFYLKTGVCKYAVNCKFDHPPPGELDAARVLPPVKLTLAGFPRREGEGACPFYMKTGTCKYGATCKYDHPPPGEAVAKAVAMAATTEYILEAEDKMVSGNVGAKAADENLKD